MTEREWQTLVVETARWAGWRVHHTPPAQTPTGRWLTPTEGHNGWPDLVLAHPKRGVIIVELKADKGRLSDAQVEWLHVLAQGGVETAVWRPVHWPQVKARLLGDDR